MRVWQKIGLGFLAVIAINLTNLGLLLYLQDQTTKYEDMASEAQSKVIEMRDILADHIRWKVNVLAALINESEPKVGVDPTTCSFGRFLLKVKPRDDEEKSILNGIKAAHERMHLGAKKIRALFKQQEDIDIEERMIHFYNQDINPSSKTVFDGLDKLNKLYLLKAEELKRRADEEARFLRNVSLSANVVVIIMALLFGAWVARSVTLPIRTVSSALSDVARGDFTKDIEVRGRDEVAEVAAALNNMLASLRPLISKVRQGASTIQRESKKMEVYSEDAVKGGEEACKRAHKMLEEGEKMFASVEEEALSIREISSAIEEISQNTARANTVTHEAVVKAQNSAEIINRLGEVSKDVQGIIKLISDIAEQTNLLALNATIEAARAGEAGKGFAVVANEVKELARQTADSTDEITRKIRAIETESEAAISVTNEITEIISQINDITSTIAAAVEEQTAVMSDIASKVDDQREGAIKFVDEAKVADKAALEAKDAALNNVENIKRLVSVAEEFEEDVSQFKV